jgi:hypothetical protein
MKLSVICSTKTSFRLREYPLHQQFKIAGRIKAKKILFKFFRPFKPSSRRLVWLVLRHRHNMNKQRQIPKQSVASAIL